MRLSRTHPPTMKNNILGDILCDEVAEGVRLLGLRLAAHRFNSEVIVDFSRLTNPVALSPVTIPPGRTPVNVECDSDVMLKNTVTLSAAPVLEF